MAKYVYLISNLEKRVKHEIARPGGARIHICNQYRNALLGLNRVDYLPKLVLFIMAVVCKEVPVEKIVELSCEVLPSGVYWKKFHNDLNNVLRFLIENIQISEEDAKLMIELGIAKVFFYKDYIEITTVLNEEVIEHGHD